MEDQPIYGTRRAPFLKGVDSHEGRGNMGCLASILSVLMLLAIIGIIAMINLVTK